MRALILAAGAVLLNMLCLVAVYAQESPSHQRIVLIVANDAYDGSRWGKLDNPVNDGRILKEAFARIGFELVAPAVNLGKAALSARLRQFRDRADNLPPGSIAVIYYTGHGVQVDGINYLVPVDAPSPNEADRLSPVQREAWLAKNFLSLDQALSTFGRNRDDSKAGANILILDACRVNPWEPRAKSGARSKGLADIPSAPNTLIAFSAAPGTTADDGASGNSIYAQVLSEQIRRTDIPVELIFSAVAFEVGQRSQAAGRQQRPDYRFGLTRNFCLAECGAAVRFHPVGKADPAPKAVPADDCGLCIPMTAVSIGGKTLRVADAPVDLRLWRLCTKELACREVAGPNDDEKLPVTQVSMVDIQTFLEWASSRFGKTYRLISSEEWDALIGKVPAGSRVASKALRPIVPSGQPGLRADLLGQVLEWTSTCEGTGCELHVVRGATFEEPRESLLSRQSFPNMASGKALGFRVVQE